jgi:predicted RNA binding protein YcfA (HicA-like mRNA interferase family)
VWSNAFRCEPRRKHGATTSVRSLQTLFVLLTLSELQVVSGTEVIRALENLDFRVIRLRGSHVMLRRNSDVWIVPLHREVKRGTLRGVLRQANVDVELFLSALD